MFISFLHNSPWQVPRPDFSIFSKQTGNSKSPGKDFFFKRVVLKLFRHFHSLSISANVGQHPSI